MKQLRQLIIALFCTVVQGAWAQFGGGDGTSGDPYIISTIDHMNALANRVNNGETYYEKYFSLEADLDYTGKTYVIIGDYNVKSDAEFCGRFNGNGHTISGVTLDRTRDAKYSLNIALFGEISGYGCYIKDLTLSNSYIKGRSCVGGIVGFINGGWGDGYIPPEVRNCHVTSDVTIETVNMSGQNSGDMGGIVGCMANGFCSVYDCTSAAQLKASSGSESVGGIVGNVDTVDEVIISGCTYTGSISGNSYVGGIVGEITENKTTLENNYVGGACTIGAIGVEGSSTGTDEGTDTKHIGTYKFATSYDGGTIITAPTVTISGTNYYVEGTLMEFSELHTFGTPTSGNVWQFVAQTADYERYTLLETDNGTWAFTMPAKNVTIASTTVSDITRGGFSITMEEKYNFTGENIRPTITLWDSYKGKRLNENTDFVTNLPDEGYKDCGTYPFTIWGIDNYGGRIEANLVIGMPWEGEGTMAKPYLIATTDDFDALAALVNKGYSQQGVYFNQTADLDYTGKTFTPVGSGGSNDFRGEFANYSTGVFKGVSISGDLSRVGIFGVVGSPGVISNVTVDGTCTFSSSRGDAYVGSIAGLNYGEISNCQVKSTNVTVSGTAAGGIVGQNQGQVYGCNFYGTVSCSDNASSPILGGIVAHNQSGEANGILYGTVKATNTTNGKIGGITGSNNGTASGANFGEMTVSGSNNIVGGIVGLNQAGNATVQYASSDCLMQNVSGTANAGAIVGLNGQYQAGTVRNCYYIGNCKYKGINNADVLDQAMRGWPISWDENVHFHPMPNADGEIVGTYYDDGTNNHYYVGAGQTLRFTLDGGGYAVEGYTANGTALNIAGHDTDYYDVDYYELTMPAAAVHIAPTKLSLVLLDNDRYEYSNDYRISDAAGKTIDVKLSDRTLYKDGEWNTICLPFTVALDGSPLEGATAKTLTDATMTGTHVTLTFGSAVTTLQANTPYIIKWDANSDADITDPIFTAATVVSGSAADRTISMADGNVKFIGYYSAFGIDEYDTDTYYMTAGSTLKHTGKARTLCACRAYFLFTEEAQARQMVLDFGDGSEENGIEEVSTPLSLQRGVGGEAWYTLDGRMLNGKPTSKGIYVRDGRKVVVRSAMQEDTYQNKK